MLMEVKPKSKHDDGDVKIKTDDNLIVILSVNIKTASNFEAVFLCV